VVIPDGVAPSPMVSVSASVNLPLHHKAQKFSSGTGSPGWSRKKGHKMVVVVTYLPQYTQFSSISRTMQTAESAELHSAGSQVMRMARPYARASWLISS